MPAIRAPQSEYNGKIMNPVLTEKQGAIEFDKFNLFGPINMGIEFDNHDDMKKCEWLRSQIIGGDSEFDSPFGRRRITYSDHTASGRFLQFVEDCISTAVLPFYGNTHTVDSHVGLYTSKLVHEACCYIKCCLGAKPHDALLFCGSGTTAAIKRLQELIGVTVPSILRSRVVNCLTASERWVVFTGPYEHHSNLLSWRQSLAEVVEIGVDELGLVDISSLVTALQKPEYFERPKLGSFSACSNVTGIYTDTRELARVLHEHGAFACFDFACCGPYVNIDMKSGDLEGYDAVFFSPHKFMGGPGSPGILLTCDALYGLKGAAPSTSGGGTVRFVNGFNDKDTLYCEDLEEREDAGTPGIVQKIRAALAFRVKDHMGHVLIRAKETLLMNRASERLLRNPSIHVLGNTCAERQPIVSFVVYPKMARGKHLHCRFVTKLLNDLFGIQARGGCACAGPYGHVLLGIDRPRSEAIRSSIEKGYEGVKPGWTRISLSYYMPVDEMEFVIDTVEFIAMYGHRFVPLYHFDWKSGAWTFINDEATRLPFTKAVASSRNCDDSGRGAYARYKEYMDVAKRIAEALPVSFGERCRPEHIDPQLVTFMI